MQDQQKTPTQSTTGSVPAKKKDDLALIAQKGLDKVQNSLPEGTETVEVELSKLHDLLNQMMGSDADVCSVVSLGYRIYTVSWFLNIHWCEPISFLKCDVLLENKEPLVFVQLKQKQSFKRENEYVREFKKHTNYFGEYLVDLTLIAFDDDSQGDKSDAPLHGSFFKKDLDDAEQERRDRAAKKKAAKREARKRLRDEMKSRAAVAPANSAQPTSTPKKTTGHMKKSPQLIAVRSPTDTPSAALRVTTGYMRVTMLPSTSTADNAQEKICDISGENGPGKKKTRSKKRGPGTALNAGAEGAGTAAIIGGAPRLSIVTAVLPADSEAGGRPTAARPAVSAAGGRPAVSATAARPAVSATAARPAVSAAGGRPTSAAATRLSSVAAANLFSTPIDGLVAAAPAKRVAAPAIVAGGRLPSHSKKAARVQRPKINHESNVVEISAE